MHQAVRAAGSGAVAPALLSAQAHAHASESFMKRCFSRENTFMADVPKYSVGRAKDVFQLPKAPSGKTDLIENGGELLVGFLGIVDSHKQPGDFFLLVRRALANFFPLNFQQIKSAVVDRGPYHQNSPHARDVVGE